VAVLTISREFGSGGREIGQKIASLLGYDYVDKDSLLEEIRAVGHKWEEWGKDLDEHCPTIWEKYDWSFRGYGALIQHFMLSHAVRGQVVIMGRGGSFLLKDVPFALRIRVVAPLTKRIDRIMSRESVNRQTAEWLAEKVDHDRRCFIHALYGKSWDEDLEYDRLFDTSRESLDEVVAVVKQLLEERDRNASEQARKTLEMRAAAARIKAGLLTDSRLFIPITDVYYDGKDIVLRAIVHNPREHRKVEEAGKKLAGQLPFRCELQHRS
jgi:cytidylate kinase